MKKSATKKKAARPMTAISRRFDEIQMAWSYDIQKLMKSAKETDSRVDVILVEAEGLKQEVRKLAASLVSRINDVKDDVKRLDNRQDGFCIMLREVPKRLEYQKGRTTVIDGRLFSVYFDSLYISTEVHEKDRTSSCKVVALTTEEAIAKAHAAFPNETINSVHEEDHHFGGPPTIRKIVV